MDDAARDTLMPWLGFERDQPLTALHLMQQLSALTGTTAGLMRLASAGLWLQARALLSEEEQAALVLELGSASPAWIGGLEDLCLPAFTDDSLSDPARLEALAAIQDRVRLWLAASACPTMIRRVLTACLEGSDPAHLAEQLHWQSGSLPLAAARTHKDSYS